jgi:hypothetical protein
MKRFTAALLLSAALLVSACAGQQLPDPQEAAVQALQHAQVVCEAAAAVPGEASAKVLEACVALKAGVGELRAAAQAVLDATK